MDVGIVLRYEAGKDAIRLYVYMGLLGCLFMGLVGIRRAECTWCARSSQITHTTVLCRGRPALRNPLWLAVRLLGWSG